MPLGKLYSFLNARGARMEATSAADQEGSPPRPSFWARLQELTSLADYRPRPAPSATVKEQEGTYVLKGAENYMRLSADEYLLWTWMDGQKSVRELAVDFFLQRQRLLPVAELVRRLRQGGFLADPPTGLRAQLAEAVQRQEEPWGRRVLGLLWGHPLSIGGIGRVFGGLYRLGGRVLFTRPALLLQGLVALAGLGAFVLQLVQGRQGSLLQAGQSYLLGFLLLLLLNLVTLSLHECAHALATIHQGCDVRRGGFMLYLGLPALFVDTTDTWTVGKRARMQVAAAGPWNDLVLGGLCALAALPGWSAGPILLKIATLAYVSALFNLNPLLELDGYFVLSDALGLPYLRRDALAFVGGELWERLRRRRALSPSERLYTVYGLLAVAWLVVLGGAIFLFWRTQVSRLVADLLTWGVEGRVVLGLLAAGVGLFLAWLLGQRLYLAGRRGWRSLAEHGHLARPSVRLSLAAGGSLALALLLWLLPGPWLKIGLPLLLYGLALAALVGVLPAHRGTPFRRVLLALGAVLVLLAAGAAVGGAWGATLVRLAQVGVLLAALAAFSAEDLVRAGPAERAAIGALLGSGAVIAVWLARTVPAGASLWEALGVAGPAFLGGLALALFVPTVVSFSGTPFAPSWMLFFLALALALVRSCGAIVLPWIWELDAASAWLLAAGAALYLLAQSYTTYPAASWAEHETLGGHARLRRAFGHFFAALFAAFRATFGRRRAQVLDDRLDIIAVTADWLVAVDGGRIQEAAGVESLPLEQLAAQYVELLERSLDIMAGLAGRPFLRRAIQAASDGLPWSEREILAHHVLGQTPWGEAVSHDFISHRDEDFRLLAGVPLFWGSDEVTLAEIAAALYRERVPAGRVLARQGEEAASLWIVAAGEVEAWQVGEAGQERLAGELHRGDTFGEEALLDKPYPATYRTSVDTALLRLEGAVLERAGKGRPQPPAQMHERARLFSWLAGLQLFRELSWRDLQAMAARMERHTVPAWEVVVREDRPAEAFYLIEAGQALVVQGWGTASEQIVGQLGPGECFGEVAPFLGDRAGTTVLTTAEGALWTLPAGEFRRFLDRSLGAQRR
jgi:putative peptide zinc metalloprotease protein